MGYDSEIAGRFEFDKTIDINKLKQYNLEGWEVDKSRNFLLPNLVDTYERIYYYIEKLKDFVSYWGRFENLKLNGRVIWYENDGEVKFTGKLIIKNNIIKETRKYWFNDNHDKMFKKEYDKLGLLKVVIERDNRKRLLLNDDNGIIKKE